MGRSRGAYSVLVEKPEGRRQIEKHRHRWEDNIKLNLKRHGMGAWTGLLWLRIQTGGWLL
jgi:hypothetical protein